MFSSSRVRFTGPLAEHREALWHELLRQGYSALSARNVLRVAAHLSRWLEARGQSGEGLTAEQIEAFFQCRRRMGYTQFLTLRALGSILPYLQCRLAWSLAPAGVPPHAGQPLLDEYSRYLLKERSLVVSTRNAYVGVAREFLNRRFGSELIEIAALRASDITAFVLESTRRYSTGATNYRGTALRSFLRYLHARGALGMDLAGAVPRVASWRLAGVPKSWNDTQLRRLLRSCDRRRRVGRRNYAVLLLLARLGLRAGEVAALTLDDVDWASAELLVCGKGRREARLPLPADVGEVLTRYLTTARPASKSRRVFLAIRAPYAPVGSSAITAIVRDQCLAAGLPCSDAHRLRHTAATAMLRAGGSLDDIAQVLRHRSVDTTAIYAKVDRTRLRTLTRPWMGGDA